MQERIAEARKAKGWTQSQLAQAIGTSQQNIQRYEKGAVNVSTRRLEQIAMALDVSLSYLLGIEEPSATHTEARDDGYVEVPLYGSIAAGTPIEILPIDDLHPIPVIVRDKYPDAFLLKVRGESMNRVLPNGCYALVDPAKTIERDGKAYAVCVNGYDATIKRVRKLANGFELAPDSTDPTYHPQVYDYGIDGTDEITVIGRVVWYCVPFDWEI